MTTTNTRQRIRFATHDEEFRYWKEHPCASFTCLIAVETLAGGRLRFLPFAVPRAVLPDLPSDAETIANIDAGRGVLVRRPGGYALRGYAAPWVRFP